MNKLVHGLKHAFSASAWDCRGMGAQPPTLPPVSARSVLEPAPAPLPVAAPAGSGAPGPESVAGVVASSGAPLIAPVVGSEPGAASEG